MTKQEKSVIYFLVAMLFLGLAVKFFKTVINRPHLKIESVNIPADKNIDVKKIIKENSTVKINSATAEDFSRLPGIGKGLAARVVEYRNQNGSFIMIEDLKNVKGIGDKKYDAIKDYLAVD
jgi:competence protein ComEA